MAQHSNISRQELRYTRADFTALRYHLNRFPTPALMERLYQEEDLVERGIHSPADMIRWLEELRDRLVERAKQANPLAAKLLDDSRSRGVWSARAVDFIVASAEKGWLAPSPSDRVSVWFKAIVARLLLAEGITTLGDLKARIERLGYGWHKPIPRIGVGKARAIERWLISNPTLGQLAIPEEKKLDGAVVLQPGGDRPFRPLELIGAIYPPLDGSQGLNRNQAYCLISARNDLEAVQAYLYKFRDRPATERSYRKELERFLLWCVCIRRVPMSSVLSEECEAYKDFLAAPEPNWTGEVAPRSTTRWRPFQGPLSPSSQKYAVLVIRSFFEWLVRVRYLGGNPWITVSDPSVEKKELEMDIDKALPAALWKKLASPGGVLDTACEAYPPLPSPPSSIGAKSAESRGVQYRLARALIRLLGVSGIRRSEAAGARRRNLKPVAETITAGMPLWELAVLGKRNKWRTVFLTRDVIEALKAHWLDRGLDLNELARGGDADQTALLSPVVIPGTPSARRKHLEGAQPGLLGFAPKSLYSVLKSCLGRLAEDAQVPLTAEERLSLKGATPHALRHTFATHAAVKIPIDVLQRLLGHTSQQTTSIYVRAERLRSIDEVSQFFSSKDRD